MLKRCSILLLLIFGAACSPDSEPDSEEPVEPVNLEGEVIPVPVEIPQERLTESLLPLANGFQVNLRPSLEINFSICHSNRFAQIKLTERIGELELGPERITVGICATSVFGCNGTTRWQFIRREDHRLCP